MKKKLLVIAVNTLLLYTKQFTEKERRLSFRITIKRQWLYDAFS